MRLLTYQSVLHDVMLWLIMLKLLTIFCCSYEGTIDSELENMEVAEVVNNRNCTYVVRNVKLAAKDLQKLAAAKEHIQHLLQSAN